MYYHIGSIRSHTHTKWHCDTPTTLFKSTVLNYKYRVLGDLQWHDTDTKFCQNSFTGSKVVSHTHTHSAIFIGGYFHEIPVISSKPSVQVSPTTRTSTVTVGEFRRS